MSSFREQTEENLKTVLAEIERAQDEADKVNARLADLQRDARAMQAAIDVMDGKDHPQSPVPQIPSIMFPLQGQDARTPFTAVPAPKANAPATLNGEAIMLEPGYRVGRNSFGEEVLVPIDSIDPPLMAEPMKPENHIVASILPPLKSSDTFGSQDPNELFG